MPSVWGTPSKATLSKTICNSVLLPRSRSASPLAPCDKGRLNTANGSVAEWSKAHAWKVCRRGTVSRVRIPIDPPISQNKILKLMIFINILVLHPPHHPPPCIVGRVFHGTSSENKPHTIPLLSDAAIRGARPNTPSPRPRVLLPEYLTAGLEPICARKARYRRARSYDLQAARSGRRQGSVTRPSMPESRLPLHLATCAPLNDTRSRPTRVP